MKDQWLAIEHYRLHTVEEWPDGPHKDGALAAIRSSVESLIRSGAKPIDCHACHGVKRSLSLVVPLKLAA
jgi:hypothetical protein